MDSHGFLPYAVLLLLATVLAVPLAKRWRLGAVLGYLGAGALIGPSGLRLIGNTEQISQISELGVVLMLFVIGMELSPQRLWVMRRSVFGSGSLQVVATAVLVGGVALAFGLDWKSALVVGLGLALSSTAIDLQLLAERKELNSAHGRLAFAILLFQDVAAIPILALIPILGGSHAQGGALDELLAALRVIATIALVVVGGRYLLRPMFRAAAQQIGTPEVFTATALLVVMGTAWLMQVAGISMSLGAFLAGVLLADSEYRHEIEAQIEPFRGLLLGLFFISVGMSLDVHLAMAQPQVVGCLLLALVVLKAIVLYGIGRGVAREDHAQSIALAALLAQGGEFAFVVFTMAAANGLLSAGQRDMAILVITLSMAATPLLVRLRAEVAPATKARPTREFDRIDAAAPRVIIAGMGRVGQIVARMLNANRIPFTALESDPEQVDFMRHFGNTVYFGDASRLDLLRAAQTEKAEIFVITTEDPDSNLRTARLLKRHFPHLRVFARARNRQHVFKLMDLGVESIVRETFFSSLEIARGVFMALGYDEASAADYVKRFREHDERVLANQYPVYDDEAALLQSAQEARDDLMRLFQADAGDEEED
ncbi:glutathione-regulated potassium-efflux system protein KefB [Dokdonella fugitiva]|uniref:Glutathione-regulated potassium-efflux system protein KefB n=1 Tax=Dokdonella fugitiva TaxID=328517 RepID=A0A839EYN4_9GAMM|nr:monovalent cation:proton antiporter-2 (CPA2) family protein [Dokdonella fugitiva]MBA8887753.1 glutathione-regulated potassium-efflux system protein KefB [Dokdonella fugitiva]